MYAVRKRDTDGRGGVTETAFSHAAQTSFIIRVELACNAFLHGLHKSHVTHSCIIAAHTRMMLKVEVVLNMSLICSTMTSRHSSAVRGAPFHQGRAGQVQVQVAGGGRREGESVDPRARP